MNNTAFKALWHFPEGTDSEEASMSRSQKKVTVLKNCEAERRLVLNYTEMTPETPFKEFE